MKIEIKGSDRVFQLISDYLYKISHDLKGVDPTPYITVMVMAAQALCIQPTIVKQHFHNKAHSFIEEGLATEDILFITSIASILETLDARHFEDLRERLYDSYVQLCIQKTLIKEEKSLTKQFNEGIKRLGEIADPLFSLLQNIIKCVDLANLFKIEISYDRNLVQKYNQIVLDKIISGGF